MVVWGEILGGVGFGRNENVVLELGNERRTGKKDWRYEKGEISIFDF